SVLGQTKPSALVTGPQSVLEARENMLFSGWKLTPAGRHVAINPMPLKLAISHDGQTLAAVCSGRFTGVAVLDLKTEQARQWIPLDRTFNGLAFSNDGKHLYVTGGNSDALYVFKFDGNELSDRKTIRLGQPTNLQKTNFFAGLTVHPKTGKLYLCNEGMNEIW